MRGSSKRVVITGASSGIGAATAEAFARRGARLVLAARDPVALEAVVERCRCLGGEASAVPTDVTDPPSVQHLAGQATERLGGIDLWFSNVGIGALGAFETVPIEARIKPPGDTITVKIPPVRPDTIDPVVLSPTR